MQKGNLPTFVDVSANFASYEIKEDNIIDQVPHYNNFFLPKFCSIHDNNNNCLYFLACKSRQKSDFCWRRYLDGTFSGQI